MDVSGSDFDHDQFFITALAVGMQARDKLFIDVDDDDLWAIDLRIAPEVVIELVDYNDGPMIIFMGGSGQGSGVRRELRIYYTYRNIWTGEKLRASDDDMGPWASADGEKILGLDNQYDIIKLAADWYIEFGDVNQVMCGDLSAPEAVKVELRRRGFEDFTGDGNEKSCPLP